MDEARFDRLARALAARGPRRAALGALLAGVFAPADAAVAAKKKHCKNGFKRCGSTCVDLGTNDGNCGRCGNDCRGTGRCCAGTCADVVTDPFNCGACGNACRESDACVNATCQACEPPLTRCRPTLATTYCASLSDDPKNCGACGKACAPDEVCRPGAGGGVACTCTGPVCPNPDGSPNCCPIENGVCCGDGACCPAGGSCTATGCCPAGTFSCGNGRCCPTGTTCSGTGCRSRSRAARGSADPAARELRAR